MSLLAAIRPEDLNAALFLHVLGALVMVGALASAGGYLLVARRDGSLETLRAAFRLLIWGALPAFIAMRIGAQWIADEEGLADSDAAWIGIGYGVSDTGLLLVIVATVAAGLALRGDRQGEAAGTGHRGVTVATWLVAILIVLYVVAIWAMTTKPA